MKIFLCLFVLIIFTALGYIYALKYKERKKFYNDFNIFNKNLANEISFSQNTIVSIVKNIDTNSTFNKTINSYFIENIKKFEKISFLNEDENKFYELYLKKIGTADKDSQLNYLKQIGDTLRDKLKACENDYSKYYLTSIKMGFLLGLIVFVFLI